MVPFHQFPTYLICSKIMGIVYPSETGHPWHRTPWSCPPRSSRWYFSIPVIKIITRCMYDKGWYVRASWTVLDGILVGHMDDTVVWTPDNEGVNLRQKWGTTTRKDIRTSREALTWFLWLRVIRPQYYFTDDRTRFSFLELGAHLMDVYNRCSNWDVTYEIKICKSG